MVGLPEAAINLSQAVILLASSPKSNASYMAYENAINDLRSHKIDDMPDHLKDSHYSGAKNLGHGIDYKYPHAYGGYVKQQYLPDNLYKEGVKYYNPTTNGSEASFKKYLDDNGKATFTLTDFYEFAKDAGATEEILKLILEEKDRIRQELVGTIQTEEGTSATISVPVGFYIDSSNKKFYNASGQEVSPVEEINKQVDALEVEGGSLIDYQIGFNAELPDSPYEFEGQYYSYEALMDMLKTRLGLSSESKEEQNQTEVVSADVIIEPKKIDLFT